LIDEKSKPEIPAESTSKRKVRGGGKKGFEQLGPQRGGEIYFWKRKSTLIACQSRKLEIFWSRTLRGRKRNWEKDLETPPKTSMGKEKTTETGNG